MSRRFFLLLPLAGALAAKTPRLLARVPIFGSDGKPIDLRHYRGRTIILMIFSTACSDCIHMIGLMNDLQQQLGGRGLQVIGAAGDPVAKYMLGPFVQRYRPLFPIGYIDKDAIIKVADIPDGMRPIVPILLFIDKWGMVREQYYGDHPLMKSGEPALKAVAQAIIGLTPVAARGSK
ncbi:MAG TPA: TlpA disulfide reductase family protein [Bryobacteraceae bacterium]|nr:TlpA disulfide reductase family protein [Bryobacteraceae bacterium]